MTEIKRMQRLEQIYEELTTIRVWNTEGEVPDRIFDRRITLQVERAQLLSEDKYGEDYLYGAS